MYKDKLKKIIAILKEEELDEIEIRSLFSTIRVVKRKAQGLFERAADPAVSPYSDTNLKVEEGDSREKAAEDSSISEKEESETDLFEKFISPMVGTFYTSSSPEKDPFVSVGKKIKKGEILCVIEAMKLMNEIEAEYDGVIKEILVEDSQPVEYGQPLFLIQPA
jgi:acetyl-CoA carboxylase biotin carboxyl carrier protein